MSDANEAYTFSRAREVERENSAKQHAAELALIEACKNAAERERIYRRALASKILGLRAEGHAATVCSDLARGDDQVANLKYERDVSEGVKDAANHAVFRASADRRTAETLIEWSMRRDLAEGAGRASEPAPGTVQTFGRRAA